jgi:hypothetical protein
VRGQLSFSATLRELQVQLLGFRLQGLDLLLHVFGRAPLNLKRIFKLFLVLFQPVKLVLKR